MIKLFFTTESINTDSETDVARDFLLLFIYLILGFVVPCFDQTVSYHRYLVQMFRHV